MDYIAGWRAHHVDRVLATLDEDCVVVESHGPTYRGRSRVQQWMATWLAEGGTVEYWNVLSEAPFDGGVVAEWSFGCVWQGVNYDIEGITIARVSDGKISSLREYATTDALYEWTGTWR